MSSLANMFSPVQTNKNNLIRNPNHMPLQFVQGGGYLTLKAAQTTSYSDSISSFFTSGANNGATANAVIANTYFTVCNITGGGVLTAVVSPNTSSNVNADIGIKITIDGTIFEVVKNNNGLLGGRRYRLVLGALTPQASTSSTTEGGVEPNGYYDNGFIDAAVNGVAATYQKSICTPQNALAYGFPVLRFESALKVECKISLVESAPQTSALALYQLDAWSTV